MYDSVPAYWHKTPQRTQGSSRSPNEAAYVFLAIMLIALSIPAAFLGWALFHGISAFLQ